jgi:hypothetical protein
LETSPGVGVSGFYLSEIRSSQQLSWRQTSGNVSAERAASRGPSKSSDSEKLKFFMRNRDVPTASLVELGSEWRSFLLLNVFAKDYFAICEISSIIYGTEKVRMMYSPSLRDFKLASMTNLSPVQCTSDRLKQNVSDLSSEKDIDFG